MLGGHGKRGRSRGPVRALAAGVDPGRHARHVVIHAQVHRLRGGGAKAAAEHLAFTSFPNARIDGFPGWYKTSGNPIDQSSLMGDNPPCGLNNNPLEAFPFECGQSGSMILNGTRVESALASESPGDSGGPIWIPVNGSHNNAAVVAILTGDIAYACTGGPTGNTCFRDFGRWIDTSVWNFINANAFF